MDNITIKGARTHNLKGVDLVLPRDKLIVLTGLSGSGKSSLAFDTLYAEGQRRYVESLSAYARQFLSVMEKPDVDLIEGLSPAISIEQKTTSHNPRSTVGTVTEIYDYLRLLYARVGEPRCPVHDLPLNAQTVTQMIEHVLDYPTGTKIILTSPIIRERKGAHTELFKQLRSKGFIRVIIDNEMYELDDLPSIDQHKKHNIEVVVDRIVVKHKQQELDDLKIRLGDSFATALELSAGTAKVTVLDSTQKKPPTTTFSANYACIECGYNLPELSPRLFSFNNPVGACETCDGLGFKNFFDLEKIVQFPDLGLASGAICNWDRRTPYYFSMLESLAKHYKFDLETPFNKLPKKIQDIILYGSNGEKIKFSYANSFGRKKTKTESFEGVIPNFERRYDNTDSDYIRDDLARLLSFQACPSCKGTRLQQTARSVFVAKKTLPEITKLSIADSYKFFQNLKFKGKQQKIADKILKEINERLKFLVNVGLEYLSLDRTAETLSGGEAQRIRLASQIGAGLVGVMYVLDEPSIGLHQRDNARLLETLQHLRNIGNTVIVVEHDEEAILAADHVVDLGPGAGVHGGQIVAEGTPAAIKKSKNSITGQYLSGRQKIEVPKNRHQPNLDKILTIEAASGNNLKQVTANFPIGLFTCVTGVSGSGKSTLVNETLYPILMHKFFRTTMQNPAPYKKVSGIEHLDKVVGIDQSPIGRTPRSNPATYTGLFTPIRELFAGTQEAKSRGYKPGRFSFNVKGGRCEACQGDGLIKVEMHFLADVYVTCDECKGKRYNDQTLEIKYKDKSIHEVLDMTVEKALEFFEKVPVIARKLQTLMDVGLSYLKIGQSATTLSGGEAQRIKLSKELSRRDTGNTMYILDEPTTGLHFHDVKQLLQVLRNLQNRGNTIVVIEHNLDVIKTCDWIIDLGPEGGDLGGEVLFQGSPEDLIKHKKSHTGRFLENLI